MSVVKVIEIMSESPNSWEEATRLGIEKASKTLKHIKSAFVQSQSVKVDAGKVTEYRVTLKVSFKLED